MADEVRDIQEIRDILKKIKENWRAWTDSINSLTVSAESLKDDEEKLPTETFESLKKLSIENLNVGIELSTLSLVALRRDPREIKAQWDLLKDAFKEVQDSCAELSRRPVFASGKFKKAVDALVVRLDKVNKHFDEALDKLPKSQAV